MEKKTPIITIILYITGILLLLISAFMLISALGYIKTYLASYGATFGDMWSNSLQYIIGQFVPYLGIGILCLGLGRAVNSADNAKATSSDQVNPELEARINDIAEAIDGLGHKVNYLSEDIYTARKVIGIKIEETERRDAYRITEMGRGLTAAMKALEIEDEPIRINLPVASAEEPAEQQEHSEALSEPSEGMPESSAAVTVNGQTEVHNTLPQIYTVSRRMTMPNCGNNKPRATEITQLSEIESGQLAKAELTVCKEEKVMKKYPQIFTMARNMVMPPCGK